MQYSPDLIKFIQLPKVSNYLDNDQLEELFIFFYEIYLDIAREANDLTLTNKDFENLIQLLSEINIKYRLVLDKWFEKNLLETLRLIYYTPEIPPKYTTHYKIFDSYFNQFLFGHPNLQAFINHIKACEKQFNIKVTPNNSIEFLDTFN